MMSGSGQMTGGILSALLVSIGIPMIMKLLGSGLHNSPYGGYKTHRKKIPIPENEQMIIKQPEGTSLYWAPNNPPPFNDEHKIQGIKEGYGLKTKYQKKERG